MNKYQVVFSKTATKELRQLPQVEVQRVFQKAKELENNPRPPGSKKLVGEKEDLWRIRIGNYRIIYTVDDAVFIVDIRRIGHRKDVYDR
jgi:mRNA interferase RelE/StbE